MMEIGEYKRLLGYKTRALRKDRGLTQAGLAEKLGVTQEYLGKIERGLASPSFPLLVSLARELGVEPVDLLNTRQASPSQFAPAAIPDTGWPPASGPSLADLPLRELHHRMRNCFQLLANMVNLELLRVPEEGTRHVLRALAARIQCLTLVQGSLSCDSDGRVLDLGDKLQQVWTAVSTLYPAPRIKARHRVESIMVPSDTAQACALVLTEFLTNMYKHAFPGRDSGTFSLDLQQRNGQVRLVLSDDGVGLPRDPVSSPPPGAMGMTLMRSYVEHTLGGTMLLDGENGTTLTVRFPLPLP